MKPDKSQGNGICWRKNLSGFEQKTQFSEPVDALPPRLFQRAFLQYVNTRMSSAFTLFAGYWMSIVQLIITMFSALQIKHNFKYKIAS